MRTRASSLAFAARGSLLLAAPEPASAFVTPSGCATATSCTLAELFGGGTITVSTQLFANR
jgi:hypothetical protein